MWFIKKEHMCRLKDEKLDTIEKFINLINTMIEDGDAIDMKIHYGKTTFHLDYAKKLMMEGYEMVYFDMEG